MAPQVDDSDDERSVLPRLVVAAWARSQLRTMTRPDRWCPTCRAAKACTDVRLVVVGREARHVCRRCDTMSWHTVVEWLVSRWSG